MAHEQGEARLRGAITAASSLLGVPIELYDGAEWEVRDGVVRVGLQEFMPSQHATQGMERALADGVDEAVARVLLLLWESVHMTRTAPTVRTRRLAIARARPELEPALAGLDRMISVTELLTAMSHLRMPLSRTVRNDLPHTPGELPRHLQWVSQLLAATLDAGLARKYAGTLAPEVVSEFDALERLGEANGAAITSILRLVLLPGAKYSAMQRFERAYGALIPPYERLLEIDLRERGLGAGANRGGRRGDSDAEVAGFGHGASDDELATPGDEASEQGGGADSTHTSDDAAAARAGDRRETAEGANLFAAERAGFVDRVLDTPLPADGAWAEHLTMPETAAAGRRDASLAQPRASSGSPAQGSRSSRPVAQAYRDAVREHAGSIEDMREVWRRVVSERIGMRGTLSRTPRQEGELLDGESLARAVAEAYAGVERPHAFRAREQRARRTRRRGSTDYVLLVDRSASMQGPLAEAAADASLIMLESLAAAHRDIAAEEQSRGVDLELEIRTALIVFDSAPLVVKPLSKSLTDDARRRMHEEIRTPRGSTDDAAALSAACQQLEPRGGSGRAIERRRVVIVVGDGGTNDAARTDVELRRLRAAGVQVIGVGIGTNDLLSRYAPDGVRLDAPEQLAGELYRIMERAAEAARQ